MARPASTAGPSVRMPPQCAMTASPMNLSSVPLVGENDRYHAHLKVFIELGNEGVRIGALGEGGEAADVGKKNGDLSPFATERIQVCLGVVEQLVDDVLGNVALEGPPQAHAFDPVENLLPGRPGNAAGQKADEGAGEIQQQAGIVREEMRRLHESVPGGQRPRSGRRIRVGRRTNRRRAARPVPRRPAISPTLAEVARPRLRNSPSSAALIALRWR